MVKITMLIVVLVLAVLLVIAVKEIIVQNRTKYHKKTNTVKDFDESDIFKGN